MTRTGTRALHLFALWLLVMIAAWPAFVLAGSALGAWSGEARQLDAWALSPKRDMLARFLEGWRASLPVAAGFGALAVLDYLLLSRYRVTWLVGGILLPIAGIALAHVAYRDPAATAPTLACAGLVLALVSRLFERLRLSVTGEVAA